MSLQEIKNLKDQKGFTIVELLIVIVVIGILAAIVIVAFNGVQARANKTAAESAAKTVQKKLEAFNAVKSAYPGTQAAMNTETESTLTGSGISIATTPDSTTGKNTVKVVPCGLVGTGTTATATGAQIFYYDYTATPALPTAPQFTVGTTTSCSGSL